MTCKCNQWSALTHELIAQLDCARRSIHGDTKLIESLQELIEEIKNITGDK